MYWISLFLTCGGVLPSASSPRSYYQSLLAYQRAEEILREHLIISDFASISQPGRQYLPILAVIGGLVDRMYRNQELYSAIYNDTLNVYGIIGISAPLLVINSTYGLLADFNSAIQEIRTIVEKLCVNATYSTNHCDVNVAKDARQNKRLKKEAKILLNVGKLAIMYTGQIDAEFNTAADSGDSVSYLTNAMESLEKLVSQCLSVYGGVKTLSKPKYSLHSIPNSINN